MTFSIFFLLALIYVPSLKADVGNTCSKFNSNMGANFDLTELVRSTDQPSYIVTDGDIPCTKQVEQNYTYAFNICGTVPGVIPTACKNVVGKESAAAFQINTRGTAADYDDWCYLVGKYSDKSTALTLLNHDDPTAGVKLTYIGDACGNGKPRTFNIDLTCADKLNPVPLHAYETGPCQYTIAMPSVYGCPTECPVANRHLCGGNGHCAYDEDKIGARCFCNHGYTGADCTQKEQSGGINYSPALLGLIITLFVIVGLLGVSIIYMVRQMNAYKEDMANYRVLKGSEDESTHV